MRRLISLSALTMIGSVCAGTLSFTGTRSTDLSDAANWQGGALPTTEDVALVDFAVLNGATAITNSTDLAFAGLVLTNLPANVTWWGTNTMAASMTTLTLGSEGWRTHRGRTTASNLVLNVNFATSAEQAWSLVDDFKLDFNGTISGTELLSITNDHYVIHNEPPAYGGKILYAYRSVSYHYACLAKKGVWAREVEQTSGRMELRFTDKVTWRELFPGRAVSQGAGLLLTLPGEPQVVFEAGDSYKGTAYLVTDKGGLLQTGGAITSSVQVGYSAYPSYYEMTGGSLDADRFVVGNAAKTEWKTNQAFRLSGGTVKANAVELGWKARGNAMSHTDISLGGGTFTVTDSSSAANGLILGANRIDTGNPRTGNSVSGAFRQTGGMFKTPQVALGLHVSDDVRYWIPLTNGWVSLSLDGGIFDVGARGFQWVANRWNARPEGDETTSVNSRYRLSFKSGTLAAYAPFTSELDLEIPANTTPLVVDTRANDVTFAAPLWGSGDFEKKGSGSLTIVDGTRHSGRIDVKEGTLKVVGTVSADDTVDGTTCWTWRAEDAVGGRAEGDEIETWTDSTGVRSAVYDGISKNGVAVTRPTVELNAFNGRPGVNFNQSALKIAKDVNPLAGSTNWTICVVLKTSTVGLGSNPAWYQARGILGREESGIVDDWGLVFDANGHFGAGMGVRGGKDTVLYSSQANSADGRPHVVFYSLDCDGTRTLVVDGEVRKNTVELNATTKSPRNKADVYLGVQNIADNGPQYYAFIGSIAEVRFYPDKALTPGERAGLGATLAAKYGASSAIIGTGSGDAQKGEMVSIAVDAPMPDDGAAAWDADSLLALDDGAAVESWTALDGVKVANLETGRLRMMGEKDLSSQVNGAIRAPVLVKNALNGHPVVHFSGNEALGIPSDSSPVSGQTAWSVAMVFRTSDRANPGSNAQFYMGRGLFGAELPATSRADWGVTFWGDQGRILAGYGGKNVGNVDRNFISRAWDLNDGEPHILITTFDVDKGEVDIQVDGVGIVQTEQKCSTSTPREAMRVLIGAMNTDYRFTGDVAAFRLYDHVLSENEREALLAGWTDRFAVPPAPRYGHAALESGRLGLGAREIHISAGASLALPIVRSAPFVLKDGQRLTVDGSVTGTLGVGRGGILDLVSGAPTALDGLWLRDAGVVKASFNQTVPVAVSTFRADGTPVVRMTDCPAKTPPKFTLFTYAGEATLAEELSWTVEGASRTSTIVVEDGKVMVRTASGTMLIFR